MAKPKNKIVAFILAVMLCMAAFSITAYAEGGDYYDEEIPPDTIQPQGNMTIVSDIAGDEASDKEFITVVTKNGNYFYIIIDRSVQGENSVHFLNKVDERDLLALLDEEEIEAETPKCICTEKCSVGNINTMCPVCSVKMSECEGKPAKPAVTPEPEKENIEKTEAEPRAILILVLLTALICCVVLFFNSRKNKTKTKGTANLDDYFDEEEDEYATFDKYDPEDDEDRA